MSSLEPPRRTAERLPSSTISTKVPDGTAQQDDGRDYTLDGPGRPIEGRDGPSEGDKPKSIKSSGRISSSKTKSTSADVLSGAAQKDSRTSSKSNTKLKEGLTDFNVMVAQMRSMQHKLDDYQLRFEAEKSSQPIKELSVVEPSQPTASSSTKGTKSHHSASLEPPRRSEHDDSPDHNVFHKVDSVEGSAPAATRLSPIIGSNLTIQEASKSQTVQPV